MFLSRINVLDKDEFLRRYTTTIGKRIYTPFDVGVPDERYDLWRQISVCVHEHQHVEQLLRDGWLKFAGRYLVSSAARAAYEAEAFRCNMELHYWRYGEIPDLAPARPATRALRLQPARHRHGRADARAVVGDRSPGRHRQSSFAEGHLLARAARA